MLKFEAWPPRPSSIKWTEHAMDNLRHHHRVFRNEGFAEDERGLTYMAQFSGHLIMSNLPSGDMETAFRIAAGLTEGWTEESKELFMYQFGYGAGLSSAEQIEAQLAKAK